MIHVIGNSIKYVTQIVTMNVDFTISLDMNFLITVITV